MDIMAVDAHVSGSFPRQTQRTAKISKANILRCQWKILTYKGLASVFCALTCLAPSYHTIEMIAVGNFPVRIFQGLSGGHFEKSVYADIVA